MHYSSYNIFLLKKIPVDAANRHEIGHHQPPDCDRAGQMEMGKSVFKWESQTAFSHVVRMLFLPLGTIIVYQSVLLNAHEGLCLTPILNDSNPS